MTMPHERMRSLRWGWELLQSLALDKTLPDGLSNQAGLILGTFPTPDQLTELLRANAPRLPGPWGQGIDDAHALFEHLQFGGLGSTQTRRDLLYTLRHFPTRVAASWVSATGWSGGLGNWIAPDQG